MGEMADWIIDNAMDDLGEWQNEEHSVECKYCGEENLYWEEFEVKDKSKWRLVDDEGVIHCCKKYKKDVGGKKKK